MTTEATPANVGSMEGLGVAARLLDCKCKLCVGACESKPGWFLPGEAEKAADLLGMDMPAFFQKKLMVDWWGNWPVGKGGNTRHVYVLSPALVGEDAGEEAPGDPRGKCVFLKRGKCEIHAAKPHECRMHIHDEPKSECDERKLRITKAWSMRRQQHYVADLLGRKPVAREWTGSLSGDIFGMLGL